MPTEPTDWLDGPTRPVRRDGASAVELDDNLALYDDVGQLLILLNTGATKVWELCDGGATVDDIAHALAEAHPDESALIAQDVRQTVRKLAALGLVVRATRTPQRAQPDAGGDGVAVRATGCGG